MIKLTRCTVDWGGKGKPDAVTELGAVWVAAISVTSVRPLMDAKPEVATVVSADSRESWIVTESAVEVVAAVEKESRA